MLLATSLDRRRFVQQEPTSVGARTLADETLNAVSDIRGRIVVAEPTAACLGPLAWAAGDMAEKVGRRPPSVRTLVRVGKIYQSALSRIRW
ncbi:hypothetical protein [Streptomyces sp. NBC_01477]|uniref:hypothetical protein n=1 Tax=Streptomyces sp. NBC_01477 TaxID=2976015 RepID=UPI002E3440C2|nr:hypothetical protein [Streptomyces sp. NBC_01477]